MTQKNFLKSLNKTQSFEGTLAIKSREAAPGLYEQPDHRHRWGHGLDSTPRKASRPSGGPFSDFEHANIPVAFLLGASSIRDDFRRGPARREEPRDPRAAAEKKGAIMKKLRLQTDEAGRITGMTIFDKSGNTTDITFTDIREGVGLEDSLFLFKVPKGTEVIEQ